MNDPAVTRAFEPVELTEHDSAGGAVDSGEASIRILSPELIARIAAGEVVERPASVLKELVENALDAGATRVRVEIEGGGVQLLSVHDDGSGMSPVDLCLAIQPHATSKLPDAARLHALTTLGFRGEALPSIASVSHFSIVSRSRAQRSNAAWRIQVDGGQPERPQARPAAGPFGTTVEARDLFYNLPARRKFLKGLSSEAAACADTLQRLALTRPDVAFSLHQGRSPLLELPAIKSSHTASSNSLPPAAYFQRVREVLGRTNSAGLIEINLGDPSQSELESDSTPTRLYGLLSPPSNTRPNRNLVYLTVNGRAVKDRTLTGALLEACRHLLPPRRYPIAALFLELPGEDVDINVHPSKSEVRFRQPGRIYALLHHAVRTAYGVRTPLSVSTELSQPPERPSSGESNRAPIAELGYAVRGPLLDALDGVPPQNETYNDVQDGIANPVEFPDQVSESAGYFLPASIAPVVHAPERKSFTEPRTSAPPADFRIIGQAAGSYIVLEDETGVRLIDQHALHERILFERLLSQALKNSRGDSQGLLVPDTVSLSAVQAALIGADSEPLTLLAEMGFDCEPFGPRTLLVRAIPAIIRHAAPAKLISDFLEALSAGDDAPATGSSGRSLRRFSLREKAAYIMSCKAALKAGERLNHVQMEALIHDFRAVAGPLAERGNLTCPHGRKLSLDLSWHELERAVGRA